MRSSIEIEDIEAMRHSQGIEDVELREEIERLHVGDLVKLTFLTGASGFETLAVRITGIRGPAFSGRLAATPTSAKLSGLRTGSPVRFTAAHIHSVARERPVHGS